MLFNLDLLKEIWSSPVEVEVEVEAVAVVAVTGTKEGQLK